ncbi:hypothetical protein NFI96_002377 [Prochilodus magdalenae]|nr:hypothetical protein NFI96_002377 [Prochilodus magdalenae]
MILKHSQLAYFKALSMVRTLNELAQLKKSGFGQPHPRHGRNLLYWFACDCVEIENGRMTIQCSPEDGDFGFHKFHNRIEDDDEDRLLPRHNLPYYEVGNLRDGVNKLPRYVTEHYKQSKKDSNKDRIIVCLNDSTVERIYVTEHQDNCTFDQSRTYRISQGLIQTIKNKTRDDFLGKTNNYMDLLFRPQCLKRALKLDEPEGSCCRILGLVSIFVVLFCACLYGFIPNTTFTWKMSLAEVGTLNEMAQLKSSGFGHRWPRHGLRLLHWFATSCVSFDDGNEMLAVCSPETGEYGFHYYKNEYDSDDVRLLPEVDFHYYVVGNLRYPKARDLPGYVRKDFTGNTDRSNMDRIIVSLDDEWFDKVYITEHINESEYDINRTYRITRGLLMIIRRLTLEEFLEEMGYQGDRMYSSGSSVRVNPHPSNTTDNATPRKQEIQIDMESQSSDHSMDIPIHMGNHPASSRGFWDYCTIL